MNSSIQGSEVGKTKVIKVKINVMNEELTYMEISQKQYF